MGDIFPTLCHMAGLPGPDVAGRNVCGLEHEPRPAYFTTPFENDQWGLRDGRWKFIQQLKDGACELFDLACDPSEQLNLARRQPQRVASYAAACRSWFAQRQEQHRSLTRNDPLVAKMAA